MINDEDKKNPGGDTLKPIGAKNKDCDRSDDPVVSSADAEDLDGMIENFRQTITVKGRGDVERRASVEFIKSELIKILYDRRLDALTDVCAAMERRSASVSLDPASPEEFSDPPSKLLLNRIHQLSGIVLDPPDVKLFLMNATNVFGAAMEVGLLPSDHEHALKTEEVFRVLKSPDMLGAARGVIPSDLSMFAEPSRLAMPAESATTDSVEREDAGGDGADNTVGDDDDAPDPDLIDYLFEQLPPGVSRQPRFPDDFRRGEIDPDDPIRNPEVLWRRLFRR